ncbi:MAG: hypothetical protein ACHQHN_06815 [Sphingobacteriales bacterium]
MKYLFALIFLPLFSFAQTNDKLLLGEWVKMKAEMKDGSRWLDHQGCGMEFVKYTFSSDGFTDLSTDVLFQAFKVPYRLTGDSLVIGGAVYNMIGLSKDTLKLSFFAPGAEDKQIPEFYFVKLPKHKVAEKPVYDAVFKDSVYQATNELFPECKDNIGALMRGMGAHFDKGTLKVSFIVDKKGRVKNFTAIEMDSISRSFAKITGNALGDLNWQPARINNLPVNTIVQVTLRPDYKNLGSRNGGVNGLVIKYSFLPQAPYPPLDNDEAAAAQQYFKDALNQVNSGNNEKAIELLGKCIGIDKIYLNAYYLRAMINSGIGKTKEACQDWSVLAGMGQVDAMRKLAKFCKN